ncbi:tyrosine-type recombinase/integrase [Enterobacter ludwigii]|uniref:tyrosine-type recombinase/integrase n=1 Tax=Enterobacter ludwigii TaxID=299767 RepID=UPI003BEEFB9B
MKHLKTPDLGRIVVSFFEEYLPMQRGLSIHTLRSYRDAMVLWMQFAARDAGRRLELLSVTDFTAERIYRFLDHLETERGNGIRTRNARLAALHTFARHLSTKHPEQLGLVQNILEIPFKRGAPEMPVDYPESNDIQTMMDHIDRRTPAGQRDYALFALMFNTGARVQEILNLRVCDLRLDPPEQVRLYGKGGKIRLCPLWPRTARLLRDLIARQIPPGPELSIAIIFRNRNGGALTRFGVRYLLRKYLPDYRSATQGRRLHPHALRHATAVHLLKSGVEFATISQLLGHASVTTTMRYARADLDLKRQALSQVFPDSLGVPVAGQVQWHGAELTRWLRRL